MFKVIQQLDCTGMSLDEHLIRTVYAADKESDSLLITFWIFSTKCLTTRRLAFILR